MKINKDDIISMTNKEAKVFFGEELYNKVSLSPVLIGVTCNVSDTGELIIYGCDWRNAYNDVTGYGSVFFD